MSFNGIKNWRSIFKCCPLNSCYFILTICPIGGDGSSLEKRVWQNEEASGQNEPVFIIKLEKARVRE